MRRQYHVIHIRPCNDGYSVQVLNMDESRIICENFVQKEGEKVTLQITRDTIEAHAELRGTHFM